MTVEQHQTFEWKHFADRSPEPPRWSPVVLAVLGVGLFALLTAEHSFAAGAAMLGIAALSVPLFLRPTTRVTLCETHVKLKTQVIWRSVLPWWSIVFFAMSIAIAIDVADGDGSVRPLTLAFASLLVSVILAAFAIRKAGRVTISARELHVKKFRAPLHGASVDTFLYNGKAPIVRVTMAPGTLVGKMKYFFLYWRDYGVDLNNLASTLQQTVRWLDGGREATPAEILAMLTAEPPKNVPLGSSVDLPLVVGTAPTRPGRRP